LKQLSINGIKISYDISGRGENYLVFLHGLGADLHSWDKQVKFFDPFYQVVRLDFRGFGASDKPEVEHAYSVDIFARDVLALFEYERIATAHLVGTSMGGYIAQQFALTFPGRVKSLILCHTTCRRQVPPEIMRTRLEALEKMDMSSYALMAVPQALGSSASTEVFSFLRDMLAKNSHNAYKTIISGHVLDFDVCNKLAQIRVPVLIITGEEDRVIPSEQSMQIHEKLPHSQIAWITRAGHISYLECPEEFNDTLSVFLAKVDNTG